MNRVGFEILARTPVPKLPQSYRPLPHPRMCYCSRTVDHGQSGCRRLIRSANALIRMCSCADSPEYSLVAQDVLLHPEITGGTSD